jgi:hypothetical protein
MPRISVTRITDDTPLPDIQRNTLVLKFPLDSWGPLDSEALAKMLREVMRDWNDGRLSFNVEMVSNGLSGCLKRALYEVIAQAAVDEFGTEIVENEDGSRNVSRWSIEADKRYAAMMQPWITSEPEVEIHGPAW